VSVVVLAAAGPLSVNVAPLPPAVGVIVPDMVNVPTCGVAVKLIPVTLALLIVAFWLVGLNVYPVWLGVNA
jgi:hypothetical protein